MNRGSPRVIIPKMLEECKECGCACNSCFNSNSLDLHHEIENVRAQLFNRNNLIGQLESEFAESRDYAEQEITGLRDELVKLRDRYDRLFESHRKLQRLNHNLEDKLLTLVNKFEGEKVALGRDISNTNSKLLDAKVTICDLEEECERFRNDCNLAVQMLHCKPSNFVAHKLDTLPVDLQQRVKSHMTRQQLLELEQNGGSSDDASHQPQRMIRVPMPTFPPTAMMYTVNKTVPVLEEVKPETVPTDVIAKVLTQPEPPRKPRRIYICDQCKGDHMFEDKEIQTTVIVGGQEVNGYQRPTPPGTSSPRPPYPSFVPHPGVHRPRLGSTETDIF